MKAFLLILSIALLASCTGPVPIIADTTPQPTPAPPAATEGIALLNPLAPTLVFSVGPASVNTTEAPQEESYFLLVRRSIETPDGIEGILPGTQVAKAGDGSLNSDGKAEYIYRGNLLLLAPNEVTTNRALSEMFAYRARSRGNVPSAPQAPIPTATPVPIMMQPASHTMVPQPGSSLDRGAYNQREKVARSPVLR